MAKHQLLPYLLAASMSAAPMYGIPSDVRANQPKSQMARSSPVLDDVVSKMYAQGGFLANPDTGYLQMADQSRVPIYLKSGEILFPLNGQLTRVPATSEFLKENKDAWINGLTDILVHKADVVDQGSIREPLRRGLSAAYNVMLKRLEQGSQKVDGLKDVEVLDFPESNARLYEIKVGKETFRFAETK